ncbi:MAG: S8 family serine peptidase [Phycisphaerae bacterium]|nr:S8 family serine peptidase [Phycisphaerae bacterium]
MKNTRYAGFILFLALFAAAAAFSAGRKSSTEAYLQQLHSRGRERVIVLFEGPPDKAVVEKYDLRIIHDLKTLNALVCEIDQTNIDALKKEPAIKQVAPDMIIKAPPPKPAAQPESQGEERVNEIMLTSYTGPADILWNNLEAGLNSQAAWNNCNLDGAGIKISFLDTAVNHTLPDLDQNYLGGVDYIDADGDPFTDDVNDDHGTKVASIAVGEGENKMVGVAFAASYYAARIVDKNQIGLVSDLMSAINWSMDPDGNPSTFDQADIISMSIGIDESSPFWEQIWKPAVRDVCNNAYSKGIVLVASSGNTGLNRSMYPAAFTNVISIGGHGEDQLVWDDEFGASNGGADIVAPGAHVAAIKPDNSGWWVWGTSFATPQAVGLIALQLQYARENNIEVNNGYLWKVMNHSAMDLGQDPVYQGKGKIWAAETDPPPATPHDGSIDLMNAHWPIGDAYAYPGSFIHEDCPAFYIGTIAHQDITLTNVTDVLGNEALDMENLDVTAAQVSFACPNDPNLPGDSVTVFATIDRLAPGDANSITLQLSYEIPPSLAPGLKQVKMSFEFNFAGDDRLIKLGYRSADSLWRAAMPGDTNLDNTVDLADFAAFAAAWKTSDCNGSNICRKADIDQSGGVDCNDLRILAENWLSSIVH